MFGSQYFYLQRYGNLTMNKLDMFLLAPLRFIFVEVSKVKQQHSNMFIVLSRLRLRDRDG
jgi:hypothetical protein